MQRKAVSHSPGAGARVSLTASNLALRVVSAAIMAPIAIAVAWLGDWPFALFWGAAALAVLWEWIGLVIGPRHGTILSRAVWTTAGVGYAGALLLAPLLLRSDAQYGFFAILWLFAIVWSTDIVAYFAGRALGGPKLAPAISPKKTWSGAIAGTLGATLFAVLMARFADGLVVPPAGAFNLGTIAIIGVLLSVLSQTGDLLESWIKRRFGAKDASGLIPGHGGVMDRLDGFWAAAVAGCVLGLVRGGFENPARGLLIW